MGLLIGPVDQQYPEASVSSPGSRSAWARLIARLYEVDPPHLPPLWLADAKEFAKRTPWQIPLMRNLHIVALITEPQQVRKDPGNLRLLQPQVALHLIKTGKASPGLDPTSLN